MDTIRAQKRQLRREIRQRRRAVPASERLSRDVAIQKNLREFLAKTNPSAVCAYSPMPGEPGGADLPEFIRRCLPSEVPIFLPRVVSLDGQKLEWAKYTGELSVSNWGIPEPTGPAIPNVFFKDPLIILPALAIDCYGRRLGQGGGFYDTFFSHKPPGIVSCAVVDDTELIDHVPTEDHDLTVGYIISGTAVVQKKGN
ncbi:5-formyltetrahydrofolate cyclo-ligase [Corynebacterium auriscanis]|uniref:5-formyltetrahydrofolate cyclo-ligase n=1 Tax=Corynebacterium auriscanis TaxID=99807 RepID=UPI003CF37381